MTDGTSELSRLNGVKGQVMGVGEERIHIAGEMEEDGVQWCPRCDMPVGVDLEGSNYPPGAFLREKRLDQMGFSTTVCSEAEILQDRVPLCDPDDGWDWSKVPGRLIVPERGNLRTNREDQMDAHGSEPVAIVTLPGRDGDLPLSGVNDVSKGLWSIWPTDRHRIVMFFTEEGAIE